MPDLLDRVRKELNARLRELRPVVREFERLERAAEAIARTGARSVPALRSRVGPAPADWTATPGARGKRGGRSAAAKPAPGATSPRKVAPRGQTQAKVLDALAAAPGSGPAAVGRASGVSTGVAAATLSRLVKQGLVRRLGTGRYAIVDGATAVRPAEQTAATQAPLPPTPGES
jgi:hypothetical protein